MSITPEQRQQWRKDAEWKTESFPFTAPAEYSKRILALLDALDAAEEALTLERHETSLVRSARGEAMADVEHYKTRAEQAQAALAKAQAEALREAADEMPFGQSHAAHLLRARADRIGGDA